MKGIVVDPRVGNREENRLAQRGVPGAGVHDERLWGVVYYRPWAEGKVLVGKQHDDVSR